MKKLVLLLVSFTLLTFNSQAQYSMDFGFSLGGANYVGEVGGSGEEPKPWLLDMNLAKTNISVGGFYRYNFTRNIAAKLSINYARIAGADSTSSIKTQLARNLSFRTDIIEAALTGEYYFFTINNMSRSSNDCLPVSSLSSLRCSLRSAFSFFFFSYKNLLKSTILTTGGFALGEISTKSISTASAIATA